MRHNHYNFLQQISSATSTTVTLEKPMLLLQSQVRGIFWTISFVWRLWIVSLGDIFSYHVDDVCKKFEDSLLVCVYDVIPGFIKPDFSTDGQIEFLLESILQPQTWSYSILSMQFSCHTTMSTQYPRLNHLIMSDLRSLSRFAKKCSARSFPNSKLNSTTKKVSMQKTLPIVRHCY